MAISRSMMERQLRAGGGIMTLDEPRQGYFLGKLVRKAKKAVKKVVKSPLGKVALLGGLGAYAGGLGPFAGLKGAGFAKGLGSGVASLFGTGGKLSTIGNLFKVGGVESGAVSIPRVLAGLGIGSAIAAPFLMGDDEEEMDPGVDVTGIQPMVANIRDQARAFYTDPASRADSGLFFMPQQKFVRPFAGGGLADIPREGYDQGKLVLGEGFKSETLKRMAMDMFGKPLRELNADEMEMLREEFNISKGITDAKEGGIMDLGGMEKDYREGGFVPIGKEERADDVPARLSKNEFVFTADAVRNAGGGDIDKGAEVMQNMMDNLEAGGMISEESQGKENPAQAMFDQAQMLESRVV
tara:strand:+ start:4362 stop:5423 length:1062 start_codon:yes stop_codon:yes gene_type:complete